MPLDINTGLWDHVSFTNEKACQLESVSQESHTKPQDQMIKDAIP